MWPSLAGASGERPRAPTDCIYNLKLNLEHILEHIKKSGSKYNKTIQSSYEILIHYCSYLLGFPLNASLDQINTKYNKILRNIEGLKQDLAK